RDCSYGASTAASAARIRGCGGILGGATRRKQGYRDDGGREESWDTVHGLRGPASSHPTARGCAAETRSGPLKIIYANPRESSADSRFCPTRYLLQGPAPSLPNEEADVREMS